MSTASSSKDDPAASITDRFKEFQAPLFKEHGPTPAGVGWGDAEELRFRYRKMLQVAESDPEPPQLPSILDVGCGWGGLLEFVHREGISVRYTGIDLVGDMVVYARERFPDAEFLEGDVRRLAGVNEFDYVILNGVLTQKLDFSIIEMERFCDEMIRAAFRLCRRGVAFNMMSTRVNFKAGNLFYQSPSELLALLLRRVTPRVVIDHAYSSLGSKRGKFYDFTVYLYKDR